MGNVLLNAFSLLLYPGLLASLILSLLVGRLLEGPASGGRALRALGNALRGRASLSYIIAPALALIAIGSLPWPALPWQSPVRLEPWRLWALAEGSALAVILSGMASSSSLISRAAAREAQLGVSGRLPIWIGVAVVSAAPVDARLTAASLALAGLAALLAAPAAAGWPPFGGAPLGPSSPYVPAQGVAADGPVALAQWARRLQAIFWLALLATVFVPLPALPWWVALPLRLLIMVALASIARGTRGLFVSHTLPSALRWCWWIALPCAVAAVLLLG